MAEQPTFLGSMFKAAVGYVKGLIAGGIVGAIGGAAIGALVGLAAGGVGAGAGAIAGAQIGASLLGGVGALAGAVTDVVKYRSQGQPTMQDVANVAQVSYQKGMMAGHNLGMESHQQMAQESSHFRDRIERERALAAQQSHQLH